MRSSPEKPPRIITVVAHDDGSGYFDIHCGEHVTHGLCWDEFLGSIAVITHPQLSKQREPLPPYARLRHIDDLLWPTTEKWSGLCRPTDKEVVAGLIEATGNTEDAIKVRAEQWRKDNGLDGSEV